MSFYTAEIGNIPQEAVRMLVRVANQQGRLGRRVNLYWRPCSSAAGAPEGSVIIEDVTPRLASEPDDI
jgi:hypothetical protein